MAIDTEKYRKLLIDERDRLLGQIETVGELSEPVSDGSEVNAADAPALAVGKDVEATIEDMKSDRLAQIDAALRRIEDGTYGICGECGKQIDPRRLEAEPTATTCMDHLTAEEADFRSAKM